MLEKKSITVIMGIYNCASTLEEAVSSLINQTYTDWNLVMCDDGSDDSTLEVARSICEALGDRVLLLKNDSNMGLNYTLNKCLDYVNGEFVARMDADDVCTPDRFQKEYDFLKNHSEYSFVSCPMILYDESGEWGVDWGMEKPRAADLIKSRPFCHAACMIRTQDFKEIGGYTVDKRLLRVEDLHLWVKLYEKKHYGYNIQEPLYKMRDDRNAYARRKFKYRLNESYVTYLAVKKLHLNPVYLLYALRPILVGLLPTKIYDILHKRSLGKNQQG